VYSILARKQAFHPMAARALVGVAGCGLLIASVELARCPQMVAFVPGARAATVENQVAQKIAAAPQGDGDRVVDVQSAVVRGDSGLHAVETKAILPAGRGDTRLAHASSRRVVTPSAEPSGEAQRQMASMDTAAPREVLLRAETSDVDARTGGQDANSGFAGQPEYVVLTAWEVMRTAPRNAGIVSDYDADANAQPQLGDAPRQSDGRGTMQITVTRMIFAVYRVDAGTSGARPASAATGAKPTHAEDSGRPPAPQQPQSGWLVLQL
jgi:hypothetical protein